MRKMRTILRQSCHLCREVSFDLAVLMLWLVDGGTGQLCMYIRLSIGQTIQFWLIHTPLLQCNFGYNHLFDLCEDKLVSYSNIYMYTVSSCFESFGKLCLLPPGPHISMLVAD